MYPRLARQPTPFPELVVAEGVHSGAQEMKATAVGSLPTLSWHIAFEVECIMVYRKR